MQQPSQKQDDTTHTNKSVFLQETPQAHSKGQALMYPPAGEMEAAPASTAPAYLQDVVLPEQQLELPENNHPPIRRGPPQLLCRTL